MSLNLEFRLVFQPKDKNQYGGRRRFAIGGNQLSKYIGEENAEKAIEKAFNSGLDKITFKYRSRGSVTFYAK